MGCHRGDGIESGEANKGGKEESGEEKGGRA